MSTRFKLILFVRFLGYFLLLSGILGLIAFFFPILQVEFAYRLDRAVGVKRAVPEPETVGFGSLTATEEKSIVPVSTDFGIVIEKINANAKVVKDVNPANESEYTKALKLGVAHAKGTSLPGEIGNTYLFSHSTDAPWNIIRYNAVFYLLRELEPGDRVIIFYSGRRFDYIVFDKTVAEPSETTYLTNRYERAVLTLQTCDPPGTLWKRLVVRSKLEGT